MKNKWSDYFMDVAIRTSELSYCERLKVGAVAVRDNRILLTGFNGTPPGDDNCCEDTILVGNMSGGFDSVLATKNDVSHAEENLITFAARDGIKIKGCGLFITHAPCIHCSKLIRNAGFEYVVFNELYKCNTGIEYLTKNKIPVYKFSDL